MYANPDVDLSQTENKIFYLKTDVVAPQIGWNHEPGSMKRSIKSARRDKPGAMRPDNAVYDGFLILYDSEAPNSNG